MTDFVDRLLGRDAGPPIRPVVPSLFEPFTPAGAEEPLPMGTFSATHNESPQRTRVEIETRVPGPPVPGPVEEHAGHAVEQTFVTNQFPEHHTSETHVGQVPVEHTRETRHHTERAELVREATEHVTHEPSVTEQHTHHVHPAAPARLARELLSESVAVERIVRELSPQGGHPVQQVRLPAPKTVTAPVVVPPSVRRAAAREPDVHISIGRVEIKALTGNGNTPPRQAKRPVLSLEDYLRERAGG